MTTKTATPHLQIPCSVGTENTHIAVTHKYASHTLERKSYSQSQRTKIRHAPSQKTHQDSTGRFNKVRHAEHTRAINHEPSTPRMNETAKLCAHDGHINQDQIREPIPGTKLRISYTAETMVRTEAKPNNEQYDIEKSHTKYIAWHRAHQHRAWLQQLGTRSYNPPQLTTLAYLHTIQGKCECVETCNKIFTNTLTNKSIQISSGSVNFCDCQECESSVLNKNGNSQKYET